MVTRTPRLLLSFASFLLAVGGAMHAAAFSRTLPAVAKSALIPFLGNSFKAFWLADSATMFILAAVFGLIAARPSAATRFVVMLLALIPAATAALIYTFVGSFFAGHLLLAVAAAVFLAGLQFPADKQSQSESRMSISGGLVRL